MTLKYEFEIHHSGIVRYRQHGLRHRIGGPAAIMGRSLMYFIRGVCYNKQDYDAKIRNHQRNS